MTDGKDKERSSATERETSKRQARENADAARDTRRSHQPGVDDDSEVVRSLVGTLGAPVENALDRMGKREADVAQHDPERGAKVPTKPEDAEAEPSEIAEDMTRDRPGAHAKR